MAFIHNGMCMPNFSHNMGRHYPRSFGETIWGNSSNLESHEISPTVGEVED